MADIELVIKIDEEDYKIMKHNIAVNNPLCPLSQEEMVSKVANGIPLPKNHGNLIDVNALEADLIEPIYYPDGDVIIDGYGYSREQIKEAPIIIEAYKEEENADSN